MRKAAKRVIVNGDDAASAKRVILNGDDAASAKRVILREHARSVVRPKDRSLGEAVELPWMDSDPSVGGRFAPPSSG